MSSATTTGGGAAAAGSRKFVTEELLIKLNAVLEQLERQQPPINPTIDAYKQENDKVAMDDKQQLYDQYQGKKNLFKTETATETSTQTRPAQKTASTQSDVLKDMEKIKEKFRTPPPPVEKATFQGYKKKTYSLPPSYHSRDTARRKQVKPDPENIPQSKTKHTSRYTQVYSPTSTPRRKPPLHVPRRLVTGVKDWYK